MQNAALFPGFPVTFSCSRNTAVADRENKMFKYEVTAQDGTVLTRKSNRTYTHAVVGTWNDNPADPRHGVIAWCGRLDLAQTQQRKWAALEAKYPGSFWEVVEVRVAA
jgi:hypothetical protein